MKGLVIGVFCGGILALATVQILIKNTDHAEPQVNYSEFNARDEVANEAMEEYAAFQQKQIEEIKKDQKELTNTLSELNQKLKAALTEIQTLNEITSQSLANKQEEQNSDRDEEEGSEHNSHKNAVVSEKQLSQYVDAVIENDGWDENATNMAWEKTHQVLESMPGVLLDDMQCGTNICRATFARVDGEAPDISNIWGKPPFMSEGFTIPQKDGSVLLYFTEEGSSIDEFRSLAGNERS